DSVFVIVFQDGTTRMLTLAELMVFTYDLVFLATQMNDLEKMFRTPPPADTKININTSVNVTQIMRPEMVKCLLTKLAFSEVASDDLNDHGAEADSHSAG